MGSLIGQLNRAAHCQCKWVQDGPQLHGRCVQPPVPGRRWLRLRLGAQDDEDDLEPKGLNGSVKGTVTALSNICNILGTFSQVRSRPAWHEGPSHASCHACHAAAACTLQPHQRSASTPLPLPRCMLSAVRHPLRCRLFALLSCGCHRPRHPTSSLSVKKGAAPHTYIWPLRPRCVRACRACWAALRCSTSSRPTCCTRATTRSSCSERAPDMAIAWLAGCFICAQAQTAPPRQAARPPAAVKGLHGRIFSWIAFVQAFFLAIRRICGWGGVDGRVLMHARCAT